MKFSTATLLSFSLVASTSASLSSMLRKQVNANNNQGGTILGAEVVLKGTHGEPTSEDMDFIGKALVASYNNVHWEVGHFLTGEHTVDFKGPDNVMCKWCPDDDAMGANNNNIFSVKTPVGVLCKWCPDDDAMGGFEESILMTALSQDCAGLCKKEASVELEVNFCNKIRSQESKYLSSAKSCAIQFDAETHKEADATASSKIGTIDSTLILKGVNGDVTKQDHAIIAKAFVSAYNDVHWGANHFLADAEIAFAAGTSGPNDVMCKWCPDDDSMGGKASTKTLVLDVITPVVGIMCKWCPDDDSMGSSMASLKMNEFNKKAVEVAFCNKLQNSVSHKLNLAKSCGIAVESVIEAASVSKAW